MEKRRPSNRKFTLSAAIMAHPKREAQVEKLLEKLDRPVPVVWDQISSRWDTGRRSMLAYDPDCTHHAVLQDDVLIPHDLLAGIERMLRWVPFGHPVCGYIGRLRPSRDKVKAVAQLAEHRKASFVTLSKIHWGPLIVVPTNIIPAMIERCDPIDIANYDLRLSRYWEGEQIRVYYTWPCITDHADGESLVPGRSSTNRKKPFPTRVAHSFVGENASLLDVDWSGPLVRGF